MIVSGSISGNIVMNEKEGQPWEKLALYAVAIVIILIGLYILCKGERAGADGRLLTRTGAPSKDPAERAASLSEMREVDGELEIVREGVNGHGANGTAPPSPCD